MNLITLGIQHYTIGKILSDLHKKGKDLIQRAEDAGNLCAANAADRMIQVIDHFSAAYSNEMDKTAENVNKFAQERIVELYALKDELDKNLSTNINQFFFQANSIVTRFPFVDRTPRIDKIEGNFVVPSDEKEFFLTFHGYFPDIGTCSPTIELKNETLSIANESSLEEINSSPSKKKSEAISDSPWTWKYVSTKTLGIVAVGSGITALFQSARESSSQNRNPVLMLASATALAASLILCMKKEDKTPPKNLDAQVTINNSISFIIDRDLLNRSENKIRFTQGILKFPRKKTIFNSNPGEDCFHFLIGSLPPSPGRITLDVTRPVHSKSEKSLTQTKESREYELRSSKRYKMNAQKQQIQIYPTPGWEVIPESVLPITVPKNTGKYRLPKGSYGIQEIKISKDIIHYEAFTKLIGHKKSGWVIYKIRYTEKKTNSTVVSSSFPTQEVISLSWGESITRTITSPSEFKVIFTAFDGTKNEFVKTDHSHPLIKVDKFGDKLEIKIPNTKDISNML